MQCNREKSCEFRGLNKCIIHSNDDGWVYYKQAYVLLAALEIFLKLFCPSFSESSGWKIGSVCLCVYNTFVSPELNLKEMSHDEYSWLKDDPYCFEVKRLRSLVHVIRNHLQMLSPILFKFHLKCICQKWWNLWQLGWKCQRSQAHIYAVTNYLLIFLILRFSTEDFQKVSKMFPPF